MKLDCNLTKSRMARLIPLGVKGWVTPLGKGLRSETPHEGKQVMKDVTAAVNRLGPAVGLPSLWAASERERKQHHEAGPGGLREAGCRACTLVY